MIEFTVFTPTYNRGHLLCNLYKSLCSQTFKSFEWIIVDDGSTDETEKIVAEFIKENRIQIYYVKQSNGGKHRAINKGISYANGYFFFIVDSDDTLPEDSLFTANHYCNLIKDRNDIAGAVGLRYYTDGTIIGNTPSQKNIECTSLEYRYGYKIKGDRAEIIKKHVMEQFLFPEFEGENFLSESIVWDKISTKYKLLYFNENIYSCEYIEGGLTSQSIKLRKNNPIGTTTLYMELSKYDVPLSIKLKSTINYWRFARYIKESLSVKIKKIGFLNSLITLPVILLFYVKE